MFRFWNVLEAETTLCKSGPPIEGGSEPSLMRSHVSSLKGANRSMLQPHMNRPIECVTYPHWQQPQVTRVHWFTRVEMFKAFECHYLRKKEFYGHQCTVKMLARKGFFWLSKQKNSIPCKLFKLIISIILYLYYVCLVNFVSLHK